MGLVPSRVGASGVAVIADTVDKVKLDFTFQLSPTYT